MTWRHQLALPKFLRQGTELPNPVTIKGRLTAPRPRLQGLSDQRSSPHTPRQNWREEGRIERDFEISTTCYWVSSNNCCAKYSKYLEWFQSELALNSETRMLSSASSPYLLSFFFVQGLGSKDPSAAFYNSGGRVQKLQRLFTYLALEDQKFEKKALTICKTDLRTKDGKAIKS